MEAKVSQSLNEQLPMVTISEGIFVVLQPVINIFDAVSIMALQSFRESKNEFPCATETVVMALLPENALTPISVTLAGMHTDWTFELFSNAHAPMERRPSESRMVSILWHSAKARSPIAITLQGMSMDFSDRQK
jgi:hypothetical protein